MAHPKQDHDDLLATATALVERASVRLADATNVVAGFRRNGDASFYFGLEPAYHFNSEGQLRRAFLEGEMYKADDGKLFVLRRERTAETVRLWSRELSGEEQDQVLDQMQRRLADFADALATNDPALLGSVPPGDGVLARIRQWLSAHAATRQVARSPRAG